MEKFDTHLQILAADLDDSRVVALLETHVATARAETARGSAHALDLSDLKSKDIKVWAIWNDSDLRGVGALKRIDEFHGELKSMHVAASHRRSGIASQLLRHIIGAARSAGLSRLSLETGSWPYFQAAREFYRRHGFVNCGPFAGYREDSNSVFMKMSLN